MINGKDKLKKIDIKSNEDIFLGYSSSSKAYSIFNNRILVVKECIHVFDETNIFKLREVDVDDDAGFLEKEIKDITLENPPS